MTGEGEDLRGGPVPGPAPTGTELARAKKQQRLQSEQLGRARSAALAWRNGMAGVLVALTGFGLVQGREDIARLAVVPAIWVGVLMALALVAGLVATGLLLYAAHGMPLLRNVEEILDNEDEDEHGEASRVVTALRRGVVLGSLCVLFLVVSVALGWYGPEREDPLLRVGLPEGTVCGQVEDSGEGQALLRQNDGSAILVEWDTAQEVLPVRTCD